MLALFELPIDALKAYLRWTFRTTGDNLLWGVWIGVGFILSPVSQLLRLPVVGGMIPDIIAILISLATVWWWWGLGLLVVVYGGIWLNLRR